MGPVHRGTTFSKYLSLFSNIIPRYSETYFDMTALKCGEIFSDYFPFESSLPNVTDSLVKTTGSLFWGLVYHENQARIDFVCKGGHLQGIANCLLWN